MSVDIAGIGALLGGAAQVGSLFTGGSKSGIRSQENMFQQQLGMQREFAKEGIRWRVADAKAAGIHPLYAMGAQLPSFNPVSVFPGEEGPNKWAVAGDTLARAGQNIGRAIQSGMTDEERHVDRMRALAERRGELENDMLASQIALLQHGGSTPSIPSNSPNLIPGQADGARMGLTVKPASAHIQEKPMDRSAVHPQLTHQEPGAVSDVGFVKTPTGYAPVPSKDAKERIEDQFVPEVSWAIRNQILPTFGGGTHPPNSWLPRGAYKWTYNVFKQEWQPLFSKSRVRVPVERR